MKRVFLFGLCLLYAVGLIAQDPNPQTSYATTVLFSKPSLYLNFNDFSTSFLDQISGVSFTGSGSISPPNGNTYVGFFTGSSNYLQTASVSTLTPAAVTVNGWFYFTSLPNSNNVLVYLSSGSGATPFRVTSAGKLAVSIQASGGTVSQTGTGTAVLAANTWYFLSYTYDSVNGLLVYVNGALDSTTAANGTQVNHTNTAYLGNWPNGSYWNGRMSDVTVYNVALTSTQIDTLYTGGTISSGLIGDWQINEGTGSTAVDSSPTGNNMTWEGTAGGNFGYYSGLYTSGTTTPRQPGFDSTQINNTSAEFPYNGFNAAPNDTLGSIEWNTPYTLMVHVDRLNWNRSGTLVLASKGDLSATKTGWWQVYLQMTGDYSQVCFERNAYGSTGVTGQVGGAQVQNGICTGATFDAVPNGYNYNIMITDSGNGAPAPNCSGCTSPLNIAINGLNSTYLPETPFTNTFSTGLGYAAVTVSSAGAGFTATTAFTSTGGGANCNVTGTVAESGGSLTTVSITNNYGCTSNPTIVLTAPTGTGGALGAVAQTTTTNFTKLPLLVPGYVSGGAYYGVAGTNNAQTTTYVDEFAIFPDVLSQIAIQGIFYHTAFYQIPINTPPQNRTAFIFDDDGCGDFDNFYALQHAISDQRYGYLKIEGAIQESNDGLGVAIMRQMLDQAGLSNVPIGVPIAGWSGGTGNPCASANITTYNASTSQNAATYPSAVSVYRTVLAANPTTPVDIITGGPLFGLAEFMQSSADSISSLTGLQLLAQDAANGGIVYMQGGFCTPSAPPASTPCTGELGVQQISSAAGAGAAAQYVVTNNGAMPLIAVAGTPAPSGPGPSYTRTSKDPMYLASVTAGTDVRTAWDSLALTPLVSSIFTGGVVIGFTGGTGYANTTAFTSTGGGASCNVQGIMTASAGVPNGIEYTWGAAVATTGFRVGIGSGCTSGTAPTIVLTSPTGTGVILQAYPTLVCGTDTVAGSGMSWTDVFASGTCSNHYVEPMSQFSTPAGSNNSAPIFQMFLNSLIDPPPNGAPRIP